MKLQPFHLAIPVNDLEASRKFYGELLGCEEGRSSDRWIDFNFYGHQLVCHRADKKNAADSNLVDGHDIPVPHFGIVMEMDDWHELARRLRSAGMTFIVEPYIRFKGQPGEQATMFLADPSGNALEFKAFRDIAKHLFKK